MLRFLFGIISFHCQREWINVFPASTWSACEVQVLAESDTLITWNPMTLNTIHSLCAVWLKGLVRYEVQPVLQLINYPHFLPLTLTLCSLAKKIHTLDHLPQQIFHTAAMTLDKYTC